MTRCCFCLADPDPHDLPAHLAAHQAADVGTLTLAVETLIDYQQCVLELTRTLHREREISECLVKKLGTSLLHLMVAGHEAERWQAVACKLWRRYRG